MALFYTYFFPVTLDMFCRILDPTPKISDTDLITVAKLQN